MQIHIGNRQQNSVLSVIIVTVFCLLFGIVAIVLVTMQNKKTADWPKTEALISHIDHYWSGDTQYYNVYVDYKIDNVTYTNVPLNAYESGMKEKDIIPIKYNPNDHRNIIYGKESFNNAFIIVGGVVCGIGVIVPSIYFGSKLFKKKTEGKIGVLETTKFSKDKHDESPDIKKNIDYQKIKKQREKAISEDKSEDKES